MLTDGQTDGRTSSIQKPEFLYNRAKNLFHLQTQDKGTIDIKQHDVKVKLLSSRYFGPLHFPTVYFS